MLPSLNFVVCGILFCVLLFAVTGAGVMLPDSRTRIGEMPEIGRPMMQRSMADIPIQPQVYMTAIARRSDELEHLREPAHVEVAPAQPEPDQPPPDAPKTDTSTTDTLKTDRSPPDLPKPDVKPDVLVSTAASDGATTANAMANPAANPAPDDSPPAENRRDDRTDEAGPPQQVATLAPVIEEGSAPIPRYVNVPLPPPRPTALRRHARVLHHRHRPVQQYDAAGPAGQAVPSSPAASMIPGVAAGYTPSEAAGRQSR
jgi:hypothetical protein